LDDSRSVLGDKAYRGRSVGLRRSPDTAPGEVERRRLALAAIDYAGCPTLAVDSLRPLADVLLDVKRGVWAQL